MIFCFYRLSDKLFENKYYDDSFVYGYELNKLYGHDIESLFRSIVMTNCAM